MLIPREQGLSEASSSLTLSLGLTLVCIFWPWTDVEKPMPEILVKKQGVTRRVLDLSFIMRYLSSLLWLFLWLPFSLLQPEILTRWEGRRLDFLITEPVKKGILVMLPASDRLPALKPTQCDHTVCEPWVGFETLCSKHIPLLAGISYNILSFNILFCGSTLITGFTLILCFLTVKPDIPS